MSIHSVFGKCILVFIGCASIDASAEQAGLRVPGTGVVQPQNATATAMPWSPGDGSLVQQNPPDFTWPWSAQAGPWRIDVRAIGGQWMSSNSSRNSISWPRTFLPGEYEWRVLSATDASVGPVQRFSVPASARKFVVPSPEEQLRVAKERKHPRFRLAGSARTDERARLVDQILAEHKGPVTDEAFKTGSDGEDAASRKRSKRDAKRVGQAAAGRLAEAALAVHVDRSARVAAAAKRRLIEAAHWEPGGGSGSVVGDNLVARDMVVGMALLYDALYVDLSSAERDAVRGRIIERLDDIKREFIDGAHMQRQPFNSHGWVAWGGAAAAAALVVGDDPRADTLFTELVPSFVTSISPWGGDQGGFANGTAYARWDVSSLILPFDIIGQAIGVDLYAKSWLANFGRFLAYFLPPGAPAGVFGDGAEIPPERVGFWTMRALAQRTHDPLAAWAAGQQGPQRNGPRALMLASTSEPLRALPLPSGTPDSLVLTDIGWAAMHSDLADPKRTSIYFKSSPYGSQSHSHADQNAFVVHVGGKALLKSSGYYDFYDSEHARQWYTTTKAHNAITFDGGVGQGARNKAAQGRIVSSRSDPRYDIVIGDATGAYMGQLSKALRTVVYLRPSVVLIHDLLASEEPRRWEWNFHADQRMQGDERSVRIESAGESLCLDFLAGPASRFEQRSGFAAPPRSKGKTTNFPDQWHAMFVASKRSREAAYVIAMRVGCTGVAPKLVEDASGWTVSVDTAGGGRSVRFFGEQVEVR
jgi:hypothetical protein